MTASTSTTTTTIVALSLRARPPGQWRRCLAGSRRRGATVIAIGALAARVLPDCMDAPVANAVHKHCGATWRQPEKQNRKIVYAVAADPR